MAIENPCEKSRFLRQFFNPLMTFHTTLPFIFTSSLLSFFLLLFQQSLPLSLYIVCTINKQKTKHFFLLLLLLLLLCFFNKTMSSIMNSQSMVLATAMVVSSTVLYLAFSKQKPFSPFVSQDHSKKALRSCLYSEEKKKQKTKKKRVRFAENVKETAGNGEEYRREQTKKLTPTTTKVDTICRNEVPEMPPNRIALYNGILRDRVHRIECSF